MNEDYSNENELMMEAYNKYINIFQKIISYAKSTILKDFPLIEIFLLYTNNTYNGCNYMSYIVVNLKRIIHDAIKDNILQYKYGVENRLLYVVLHESFHQLQPIILSKYLKDKDYNNYIEGNCDYNTIRYLDNHREEIESALGIELYKFSDVTTLYDNNAYFPINNKDLGYKLFTRLMSILYQRILPDLDVVDYYNWYYQYSNINIYYANYDLAFDIKSNNIFNMNEFNNIIYNTNYDLVYAIVNRIDIKNKNNKLYIYIELSDIKRNCLGRI